MEIPTSSIQRGKRTPIQVAGGVLSQLSATYAQFWKPPKPEDEYIKLFFSEMWKQGADGDKLFEDVCALATADPGRSGESFMRSASYICGAYCVQAMKAQKEKDTQIAWTYVADARFWLGIIAASVIHLEDNREKAKQLGRDNAFKRHRENHAFKAYVFEWYGDNSNRFKSMDAAAAELVKHVPVTFRTVRQWLTRYKQERSASEL